MIIENHATGGSSAVSASESNPFGHTALAITGRGVYSMGNADRGDRQDNKRNILGGGVMEYIMRESPRRDTTIIIVKTTPEQDAAIAKSMEEQAASKPQLTAGGIVSDNCSLRVNRALDAAGGINMSFAAGLNAPVPVNAWKCRLPRAHFRLAKYSHPDTSELQSKHGRAKSDPTV